MIKLLLVAALALVAVRGLAGRSAATHRALVRLLGLGLLLAAVVAVLVPDLVTRAAHLVGVGRGTDLVLYVAVVAALAGWLGTQRRLHELDRTLTLLARHAALRDAGTTAENADPAVPTGQP